MKKIELGQALGILANVGVLFGILLLVYELTQNREMMRAQTRNELSRGLTELLGGTNLNGELADIIIRANHGEDLTDRESFMLGTRNELVIRYWENVHYQYRLGMYDESEFSRHRDTMEAVIAENLSLADFWCRERMLYSEPFMLMLDDLLVDNIC